MGEHTWISSITLRLEVERNRDTVRRNLTLRLLNRAQATYGLTPEIQSRAKALHALGLGSLDAQHLAVAEAAEADALLTTDDRFLRFCARLQSRLDQGRAHSVEVLNPVDLLRRMTP